jgi:hypothetical protein
MTTYVFKSNLSVTATLSCPATKIYAGVIINPANADYSTVVVFKSKFSLNNQRTSQVNVFLQSLNINWQPSTNYSFVISGLTSDISGQVAPDQTFTYTTNALPTILSSSPTPGATGLLAISSIVLTFGRQLRPVSGNFYLYQIGTGGPTLVKSFNVQSQITITSTQVILNVTGLLQSGTVYYLLADSNALKDYDNFNWSGISSTTAFRFTTAGEPTFPDLISYEMSMGTLYCKAQPWQHTSASFSSSTSYSIQTFYSRLRGGNFNFTSLTAASSNAIKIGGLISTLNTAFTITIQATYIVRSNLANIISNSSLTANVIRYRAEPYSEIFSTFNLHAVGAGTFNGSINAYSYSSLTSIATGIKRTSSTLTSNSTAVITFTRIKRTTVPLTDQFNTTVACLAVKNDEIYINSISSMSITAFTFGFAIPAFTDYGLTSGFVEINSTNNYVSILNSDYGNSDGTLGLTKIYNISNQTLVNQIPGSSNSRDIGGPTAISDYNYFYVQGEPSGSTSISSIYQDSTTDTTTTPVDFADLPYVTGGSFLMDIRTAPGISSQGYSGSTIFVYERQDFPQFHYIIGTSSGQGVFYLGDISYPSDSGTITYKPGIDVDNTYFYFLYQGSIRKSAYDRTVVGFGGGSYTPITNKTSTPNNNSYVTHFQPGSSWGTYIKVSNNKLYICDPLADYVYIDNNNSANNFTITGQGCIWVYDLVNNVYLDTITGSLPTSRYATPINFGGYILTNGTYHLIWNGSQTGYPGMAWPFYKPNLYNGTSLINSIDNFGITPLTSGSSLQVPYSINDKYFMIVTADGNLYTFDLSKL